MKKRHVGGPGLELGIRVGKWEWTVGGGTWGSFSSKLFRKGMKK